MMQDTKVEEYNRIRSLGMCAMPIVWDAEKALAKKHPDHENWRGTKEEVISFYKENPDANGRAFKLYPPFGMIDFDLKHSVSKTEFTTWREAVFAINPDILRKLVVETTRNAGYHVYFKYQKLTSKVSLARTENNDELIAIYTGPTGLLSYTWPTPGYHIVHNDLDDITDLTDDEYDLITSVAISIDRSPDDIPTVMALVNDYPAEHENICLQFDKCGWDVFVEILASINLKFKKEVKRAKYGYTDLFIRSGSTAPFSAKVNPSCNRVMIFSGSMPDFPTYHTRTDNQSWVLSPSKVIFYKNKQNWLKTMEEINMIAESAGILFKDKEPEAIDPSIFPYDVLPTEYCNYINVSQQNLREYMAGAMLVASATAIGNKAALYVKDRRVTTGIYMALVAPPGSGKSPALKKAFAPLDSKDSREYNKYKLEYRDYKEQELVSKKEKQPIGAAPHLPQMIIKDSTIEKVINILSTNPNGCTLFADELAGFIMRMNQYRQAGDELQKWLEMWSGDPVMLQRVNREENRIDNPFCCVIGGVQPGILGDLSQEGKEKSGFWHRFLFIYPEINFSPSWGDINDATDAAYDYTNAIERLLTIREGENEKQFGLSDEADRIYGEWYDKMNQKWLSTQDENIRGIISKYKDYYCLRLALLLATINGSGVMIPGKIISDAIRLTEYFLEQIRKAVRRLSPDSPVDKLDQDLRVFYEGLPENFSLKMFLEFSGKFSVSEKRARNFLNYYGQDAKIRLFKGDKKQNYEKTYW